MTVIQGLAFIGGLYLVIDGLEFLFNAYQARKQRKMEERESAAAYYAAQLAKFKEQK
jgi:predicted DNA repair protein MutK